MTNLITFILITYGMTQISTSGSIFDKIRPKPYFFRCPMCQGFWIGLATFLGFWICDVKLFPNPYLGAFLFGCLSSGTSYFLCSIIDDYGIKIEKRIT